MVKFAETFGLLLFVYTLGLHVGPSFGGHDAQRRRVAQHVESRRHITGTALALLLCPLTGISVADMTGILCGATTNTPALAAAQQALTSAGFPAAEQHWDAPLPIRSELSE